MKHFAFLILLISAIEVKALNKSQGLQVLNFSGRPQVERNKSGSGGASTVHTLRKNEFLKGHIVFKTDAKSEVTLQLEPHLAVKIYPDSEVVFPLIRWEDGALDQVLLKQGKIRWQSEGIHHVQLKSDLYEAVPPAGLFLFSYQPKAPEFQVMVMAGEIDFQELNGEESVHLKSGQKIHFLGQIEDGQISYDLLLQGRKIPKGQKSQVEELNADDLKKYSIDEEMKRAQLKNKKSKAQESKRQPRKGEICQNPPGLFNECAWICENNLKNQSRCRLDLPKVNCVRFRCNANGAWAERFILEKGVGEKTCQKTAVVQPCDY